MYVYTSVISCDQMTVELLTLFLIKNKKVCSYIRMHIKVTLMSLLIARTKFSDFSDDGNKR